MPLPESLKVLVSIVQGLGVVCSILPLKVCGPPGVMESRTTAGAPVGRAVETAKMVAQHKRIDSIFAQRVINFLY